MRTDINLPIALDFYSADQAANFRDLVSSIIPKIKFEETNTSAPDEGNTTFIFFTRKDERYRDMVAEMGGVADAEVEVEGYFPPANDIA